MGKIVKGIEEKVFQTILEGRIKLSYGNVYATGVELTNSDQQGLIFYSANTYGDLTTFFDVASSDMNSEISREYIKVIVVVNPSDVKEGSIKITLINEEGETLNIIYNCEGSSILVCDKLSYGKTSDNVIDIPFGTEAY